MIRGTLALLALASVVLFPWPVAVLLGVTASFTEPLVPVAVGLFADAIYYSPHAGVLPYCTLCGAAVTAFVFFVRSQLKTGSIGG